MKECIMARKNGADKKIQILEALNQCLQIKPFDQTSIKDIAQAAGVNHGLLHYYFKSKEDILIHYIDYVIDHYRAMFMDWLTQKEGEGIIDRELIEAFFKFMNEKITLNRPLSTVFIEIWEIAVYNPAVKSKLKRAYQEWMEILTGMLSRATKDTYSSRRISFSIVAFLEGMALFSIILDPDKKEFKKILAGFQEKIVEML
jgi:AcrR family transcriptional regulator